MFYRGRTALFTIITASTRFATKMTLRKPWASAVSGSFSLSPIIHQSIIYEGFRHWHLILYRDLDLQVTPSTINHQSHHNCVIQKREPRGRRSPCTTEDTLVLVHSTDIIFTYILGPKIMEQPACQCHGELSQDHDLYKTNHVFEWGEWQLIRGVSSGFLVSDINSRSPVVSSHAFTPTITKNRKIMTTGTIGFPWYTAFTLWFLPWGGSYIVEGCKCIPHSHHQRGDRYA